MLLVISISLIILFLSLFTMLSCISCLNRKEKNYEDIKYNKKSDLKDSSIKKQDSITSKPNKNSIETTSELYTTIPDRLDGLVSNLADDNNNTNNNGNHTVVNASNDLYSYIAHANNNREDLVLNASCYSRLPIVPEKKFDISKEFIPGEQESGSGTSSAYSKIPNDYESNRTTTNHYDIVPEYETISQMIIVNEQSSIVNDYTNNSIHYMEFNETVPQSSVQEIPQTS